MTHFSDTGQSASFLPARMVWERYGVTSMTLRRWMDDEKMNFPRPVYMGGGNRYRYWRLADLEAWERERITRGAA